MAKGPRAHGRTQPNVSVVTFRFGVSAPLTITVHGRPSEVRARIQAHMAARKPRMTFHDLKTDQDRTVILTNVETWTVK